MRENEQDEAQARHSLSVQLSEVRHAGRWSTSGLRRVVSELTDVAGHDVALDAEDPSGLDVCRLDVGLRRVVDRELWN